MSDSGKKRIQQRNLWETIADDLREEIHSGVLEPGSHLTTADLAERWGVSRGPVREALMALESEGIVVSSRRHGTIVGTPSTLDLQEIYAVREAIETAAAVILCEQEDQLSQRDLRELNELLVAIDNAWEHDNPAAAMKKNFAFHQMIIELSGNSRFANINKQMVSQTVHHLRGVDPHLYPRVGYPAMKVAHRNILDALVAGDAPEIRLAIHHHYERARARTADVGTEIRSLFTLETSAGK